MSTEPTTLVRVLFGSQMYGTATPESDTDYKSVHIPLARDILLCQAREVNSQKSRASRPEGQRNTADDIDDESFALHKFLRMLDRGDMVAVELMFAPASCVIQSRLRWQEILSHRNALVTRNCTGFVGYCRKQAAKYGIKGSRMAAVRTVLSHLDQLTLGSTKMRDIVPVLEALERDVEHVRIVEVPQANGEKMKHFEVCDRKLPWTITVKEAVKVLQALFDNYGERTRAAERSEGIDWKAVAHAVRVGQQAIELLHTGFIQFPRPNAPELLRIKRGERPYAEVSIELEDILDEVQKASLVSVLPEASDDGLVEAIITSNYATAIIGAA